MLTVSDTTEDGYDGKFSARCEIHTIAKYALAPGAECFLHCSCHLGMQMQTLTRVVLGTYEEAYQCKGTAYD